MKNLKKVLALVLVAATLMGLAVSASAKDASDYKDYNEVAYKEAVDVMSNIGVFNGSNGSFNPKGILTREEAAKIVTYMLMGKDDADKLVSVVAPYSDVPASRWSAGSIAYCKNQGILAGVGSNKFDPAGKLTGLQFAKMLLVALGYDAKIEKLTGSDWAVNVARLCIDAGLDDNMKGVSLAAQMTREQACQMALNTLEADLVTYQSKGTEITLSDGSKVVIGNTPAAAVADANNDYDTIATDKVLQFAERYFPDLTKDDDTDDFGRPGSVWQNDGTDVTFSDDEAVATFTAKTKAADVAKSLKGYLLVDGTTTTTKYKIENTTDYSSSKSTGNIVFTKSATATGALTFGDAGAETIAEAIADETANGKLIEFYADSKTKEVKAIVVVEYTTVEVAKVSTDKKTGDVSYKLSASDTGVDYADADEKDTIVLEAPIEKGDIVTYVKVADGDGANIFYVYPTTTFEGTQTATKTDSDSVQTITVDGTKYTVGAAAKSGTTFTNSKDSATYYVDQYGFVVHTDSKTTASTDYAMVVAVNADVKTDFDDETPSVEVRVVMADGTIGVYNVALEEGEDTDAGKWWIKNIGANDNLILTEGNNEDADAVKTAAEGDLKDKLFGYTLDEKTITFEALNPLTSGNTDDNTVYTVAVGAATDYIAHDNTSYTVNTDQSVLVNGTTKFVAYNSTDKEATVYTGVANLPKSVSATQTGHAVLKTGTTNKVGTASVVFFTITSALTADDTDDLVYVDGDNKTTVMVDGKNKTQYIGYKPDGTTVELIGGTTQTSGLYAPNADNEISGSPKGTSSTIITAAATALTVNDEGDMVMPAGGSWYYITEDTQVVYVDSDLDEINGNQGFLILVKDTQNVDVIYITAD